jgi:hypothetical protein
LKEKGENMFSLRANSKQVIIILLFASLILNFSLAKSTLAATTTVQVDPPVLNVNSGDVFNVNITITQVTNLTGWEFKLFYLRALLNCSAMVEGPFLKSGGSTTRVFNVTNNYNSTHGRVLAGCALLGMDVSVNGTGTIATLTFKALAGGDSPLDLVDTKLSDEKIPPLPIAHTAIDGVVHIAGAPPLHDIAAITVTTSKDGCKPMMTVPDNMFVNVNITVANIGNSPESFNVILYANTTAVDTTLVSNLAVGAQSTVAFKWNATGWTHGNYTISGYAVPVSGETSTTDNTLVSGIIRVVIPGNINGDVTVDIFDAILLANAFNSSPGNPKWSPNADLMTNDAIDIFDAIVLANHFGQHE